MNKIFNGFLLLDLLQIINTSIKNNTLELNKSIIISYRESSDERKYNLQCLLDYFSHLQDGNIEIIIVEQDDSSKINWLQDIKGHQFIKHIFVKNDGIFNKGWGYNIGAKRAETETLIFSDSDIFIKPQTFSIGLKSLEQHDVVNPYRSVVFLDKEASNLFKSHNFSFVPSNKFKPIIHTIITGGIFFMKKKTFMNLKGFDEDCYGYGHEDDILDEKIRKLGLSVHTLNDISIHIYHEPANNNEGLYYSFMEINKQLFADYKKMTKQEIENKIENTLIWGDISESTVKDSSTRHIKRIMYENVTEKIVEHTLSKFDEQYLDEIVNDISTKIYNNIIETITEKVKYELNNINYSTEEKETMVNKIMKKFRL